MSKVLIVKAVAYDPWGKPSMSDETLLSIDFEKLIRDNSELKMNYQTIPTLLKVLKSRYGNKIIMKNPSFESVFPKIPCYTRDEGYRGQEDFSPLVEPTRIPGVEASCDHYDIDYLRLEVDFAEQDDRESVYLCEIKVKVTSYADRPQEFKDIKNLNFEYSWVLPIIVNNIYRENDSEFLLRLYIKNPIIDKQSDESEKTIDEDEPKGIKELLNETVNLFSLVSYMTIGWIEFQTKPKELAHLYQILNILDDIAYSQETKVLFNDILESYIYIKNRLEYLQDRIYGEHTITEKDIDLLGSIHSKVLEIKQKVEQLQEKTLLEVK
jgi:hypothetical protein